MIVGTRPCCGAPSMVTLGPAPCWERIVCDSCGAVLWLRHSRLDPEMLTEAEFQREYECVDKTVQRRAPRGDGG